MYFDDTRGRSLTQVIPSQMKIYLLLLYQNFCEEDGN